MGVQVDRPRRSSPTMGYPEEQAEDELREAVARAALLLRQEHYTQDCRKTLRLPVRLRPTDTTWVRYLHLHQLVLIHSWTWASSISFHVDITCRLWIEFAIKTPRLPSVLANPVPRD